LTLPLDAESQAILDLLGPREKIEAEDRAAKATFRRLLHLPPGSDVLRALTIIANSAKRTAAARRRSLEVRCAAASLWRRHLADHARRIGAVDGSNHLTWPLQRLRVALDAAGLRSPRGRDLTRATLSRALSLEGIVVRKRT
jgi:hypothetical protein